MSVEEARHYVGAQSNWYLLVILGGDIDPADRARAITTDDLVYEQIIAWVLDYYQGEREDGTHYSGTHVFPLTIIGEAEDNLNWAIKTADGAFRFNDDMFDSKEDLLEAWNKQRLRDVVAS